MPVSAKLLPHKQEALTTNYHCLLLTSLAFAGGIHVKGRMDCPTSGEVEFPDFMWRIGTWQKIPTLDYQIIGAVPWRHHRMRPMEEDESSRF
jgi:hypothetical protein